MGIINLTDQEIAAINGIHVDALKTTIDRAIETGNLTGTTSLVPYGCGPFLHQKLRTFESAVQQDQNARSARKCEQTHQYAITKGWDLSSAVFQMQGRAKDEISQREFFYVEDDILPPLNIHDQMSVLIPFRWRRTNTDEWCFASITFDFVASAWIKSITQGHQATGS